MTAEDQDAQNWERLNPRNDVNDIAEVCAKLRAIAEHLEALDSESGEAKTFRMCAAYLKQQEDDIFRLRGVLMAEIAAEHRALDEWRENGGPDWKPSHPVMMRLQRLTEALQ